LAITWEYLRAVYKTRERFLKEFTNLEELVLIVEIVKGVVGFGIWAYMTERDKHYFGRHIARFICGLPQWE